MEYKEYFGQVLRQIRKNRGLSAEQIEKKYGISAQCIYGYEQGKCIPKKKNLEILCNALNISPEHLHLYIKDAYTSEIGVASMKFDLSTRNEEIKCGKINKIPSAEELAIKIISGNIANPRKTADEKRDKISNVELVTDLEGAWLPVITEAAAAECNPGIMPLLDCVAEYSEEQAFFPQGKKTDFAIKVSGNSMMPWYPPKTLLLVRPYQDIQQGKRVVAVLDNGEILFKIFARTNDNRIALMSINDEDGQDFFFPSNGKGIRYICRVIQSIRNEDDLDEAMRESGIHHNWEEKLKKLQKGG